MRRLALQVAPLAILVLSSSKQADACKVKEQEQRKVAARHARPAPEASAPAPEQATPAPETPTPVKAETPTSTKPESKPEPAPTEVATRTPAPEEKSARAPVEEKSTEPPASAPPAKGGKGSYHEQVRFTSGTNLDKGAKKSLDELARWMQANPDTKVMIEGHCDATGSSEFNQKLGERRAEAVKSYLEEAGVESSRMDTVSQGDTKPKYSPNDRRNRRAAIVKQ